MVKEIKLDGEITDITHVVKNYETMKLIKIQPKISLQIIINSSGSLDFQVDIPITIMNRNFSIKKPPLANCTITIELS
jgi:hypothetical protein